MANKSGSKVAKKGSKQIRKKRIGFAISDYVDVSGKLVKGEKGDIQFVLGQRFKIEKVLDDLFG